MKSLKRLFTSILPTSWTAEEETQDGNLRKRAAERYFQDDNREIRKGKRRMSKAQFLVQDNRELQPKDEVKDMFSMVGKKSKPFFEDEQIYDENAQDSSKGIDDAEEDLETQFDNMQNLVKRQKTQNQPPSKFQIDQNQLQQIQKIQSIQNTLRSQILRARQQTEQIQSDQIVESQPENTQIQEEDKQSDDLRRIMDQQKRTALQSFKKVEGLTCPICMDLIVACRIAVCGHSFCHQCISECLVRRKECPSCRKNIRRKVLQLSLMIDNSVKMIALAKQEQGEPEEFQRWQDRMKKYKEWVAGHRVTIVKPGDKLDVNDTENIWCRATVELIVKTENRVNLLYLHYEGWNRKYDEYMYQDSHRVAPLGFYTNRTDIPIYRMMQNSGGPLQMMYAVVLQNTAEGQRLEDYERRIATQQQQSNNLDEEDEEEEDIPAEEGHEEADPSVSHHTEHPQNSDIQSLLEQPAQNLEAEIDRSIENVNNQLNRHFPRQNLQQEHEEQSSSLVQDLMDRTIESNVQQQQQQQAQQINQQQSSSTSNNNAGTKKEDEKKDTNGDKK